MPDFTVSATNHTSFTVSSLDRTIAFFEQGLGFEVTSRAPRDPKALESITGVPGADVEIAFVRGPGHSIELIEYLGPDDRGQSTPRPCDVGFSHVAYDIDDIDKAVAAVAAHGFKPMKNITVIDKGPNAGMRVAYMRDEVDGLVIEFIEKKTS